MFPRFVYLRLLAWLLLPRGKHRGIRWIEFLFFKNSQSGRERDIKLAIATVNRDVQGGFSVSRGKPFRGSESAVIETQLLRLRLGVGHQSRDF